MATSTSEKSIWQAITTDDVESVRPWLQWHPSELDACVQARGGALPEPLGDGELDALLEAHRRWDADEASLENVRRLAGGRARVVVSGQQPGLLGGPLYTLYKALGSVKLAAALRKRHPDLDFVPVFWVASEDHDYDEVASVTWPQAGGDLITFRAEHPDWTAGRMVGTLASAPVVEPLVEAILQGTHDTEFRAAEIEALRREGRDGTWEDLFCRLMLRLTRGTGLMLVSPLMPWVRRRSAAIFGKEIETAGESTRLVLERSEAAEKAGLETPLHRNPDAVNLFRVDAAQCRRTVRVDDGRLIDAAINGGPNGGESAGDKNEWRRRLEADPSAFSANVVTRPLIQDSILPTVAQLVGPGEAAYFAQVEAVYESFGVFAPVRYPRPRVLLVARNVARTLRKYDLDPLEVIESDAESLVHAIQQAADEGDFAERLRALRERQQKELRELQRSLGNGGGAHAAIDRLIQSMEKGFDTIDQQFRNDRRQQEPQLETAMNKLLANLTPNGAPQERVFNPVAPFLVSYGPSWLKELHESLAVDATRGLQVMRL